MDRIDVWKYINEELKRKKLHATLIDPENQGPKMAGKLAKKFTKMGTSFVMVGGSTLKSQQQVDDTVIAIKKNTDLPVIIFPSGARFLSKYADALLFMSLLNSRNPKYIIREQAEASLYIEAIGMQTISMGYLIVEPGMTVGKKGEADLIKRNDTKTAVKYLLAAKRFGFQTFYVEAGSGANETVPEEMIESIKVLIKNILFVGGGIKDIKTAEKTAKAGADIIVTGNAIEGINDAKMENIIKAINNS